MNNECVNKLNEYEHSWNTIMKDLKLTIEIPLTGDFINDYFNLMRELNKNIKNNTYIKTINSNDRQKLIDDLYTLGRLFYGYRSRVNDYYRRYVIGYSYKEFIPSWDTGFGYLPTSHNYNSYLKDLTPALYENYYLLQIGVIEEFVDSMGKQPKYLYELINLSKESYWYVIKLELFTKEDIDIGIDNLNLPNYYAINNDCIFDLSYHKKLYEKYSNQSRFSYFLSTEYPILMWIKENRKNGHFKMEKFYQSLYLKPKMRILQHLSLIDDGEIINMEDLSYYYGIERENVFSIMEELVGDEEHGGKVIKSIDENGNVVFIKKDTFSPTGKK